MTLMVRAYSDMGRLNVVCSEAREEVILSRLSQNLTIKLEGITFAQIEGLAVGLLDLEDLYEIVSSPEFKIHYLTKDQSESLSSVEDRIQALNANVAEDRRNKLYTATRCLLAYLTIVGNTETITKWGDPIEGVGSEIVKELIEREPTYGLLIATVTDMQVNITELSPTSEKYEEDVLAMGSHTLTINTMQNGWSVF